ncbi:MAG TPA: phosphoesterase [Bacillota bacterium]|jgi:predicted NUDIX family phosphoesterase|nr:phosphoesterase [Bacillota bacterium]HPZ54473.1 phosphoesterase [Bacillota bacterium]HQD17809.1 phosphoesterase [Bacillota bacterium]
MKDEEVLVVPRSSVFPKAAPQGFIAQDLQAYLDRMSADYRFEPRARVENDPSLKQLIPYVVFMYGESVYVVKRSSRQSEQRLVGKHSIGIGGHINKFDASNRDETSASDGACNASGLFASILTDGLHREINEEIYLGETPEFVLSGLINDDSNSVGSVHLGLVYIARLSSANISVREKDMMSGSFVDAGSLNEYYDTMETWSQIVIDSGCLQSPVGN